MWRNSVMSRVALVLFLAVQGVRSAALQWATIPQGRSAPVTVARQGKAGFTLLQVSETGIQFIPKWVTESPTSTPAPGE